jgi:hypothetical protein
MAYWVCSTTDRQHTLPGAPSPAFRPFAIQLLAFFHVRQSLGSSLSGAFSYPPSDALGVKRSQVRNGPGEALQNEFNFDPKDTRQPVWQAHPHAWPGGVPMRRREFIRLLGGAAATWPLAARAQQGERVRRIGVLTGGPRPDDQDAKVNIAAFLGALQRLGWTEGRNVRIDYRWGLGLAETIRQQAAELSALAPDVILSSGTASLAPLMQSTSTVPIVFVNVADPVGAGYVESLARPGRNATGFIPLRQRLELAV